MNAAVYALFCLSSLVVFGASFLALVRWRRGELLFLGGLWLSAILMMGLSFMAYVGIFLFPVAVGALLVALTMTFRAARRDGRRISNNL